MLYELWVKFKEPIYGKRGWYRFTEHATQEAAEFKMTKLYDSMLDLSSRITAWRVDCVDLMDPSLRHTVHEEGQRDR